jgi:hypothetical protein
MEPHVQEYESMAVRPEAHKLASWMSRSFGAMRADLEYVDAGSLEVLLLCPDEVDAREPRERRVDLSR